MLPGKKYKPEDLLRLAKKRMWLLLVPFAIVSAGTAAVARKLPDYYQSSTMILVEPQRVPESYVKATVTTRIEDRLGAIRAKIHESDAARAAHRGVQPVSGRAPEGHHAGRRRDDDA